MRIRGGRTISEKDAERRTEFLEQFTTDLTEQARRGELDPVIGREAEIKRVIQILSRRKKNNPVVIGEQLVLWPDETVSDSARQAPRIDFGVGVGSHGSGVGVGIGF